jgi:hypothetical protein
MYLYGPIEPTGKVSPQRTNYVNTLTRIKFDIFLRILCKQITELHFYDQNFLSVSLLNYTVSVVWFVYINMLLQYTRKGVVKNVLQLNTQYDTTCCVIADF